MDVVHVVIGQTGEYSDRREWMVCGYVDEAMAQEHVRLASARAREIFTASNNYDLPYEARENLVNEYDPDAQSMDYTGTEYYIAAVDIRTAITAAPKA